MKIFSNIKWAIMVGSICLWVLSVDHIAQRTEQIITASLENFSDSAGSRLIKAHLKEYHRSFRTSRFTVVLSSDHPSIHDMLQDIVIMGKVLHGPVVFADQKFLFKTAHIDFSFYNAMDSTINEKLLTAQMSVDYDLIRQLKITFNAMNLDVGGIELVSKAMSVNYDFHPEDELPDQWEFSLPELTVIDRDIRAEINGGKVTWALSSIQNELDSVRFIANPVDLDIKDIIDADDVGLAAELAFLDTDVVSLETDLVSNDNPKSTTTIKMDNLNLDSFKDAFVGFLNYRNLNEQIDWTLEDSAYSPDGQDRLYELLRRLDENGNEMTEMLANRLLTPNKSRIQISQTGDDNQLLADLTFVGLSKTKRESPWYNSLAGTIHSNKEISSESWFHQLEDYTSQTTNAFTQGDSLVKTSPLPTDIPN